MNANELWDSTYAEKDLRPTDTCRGFAVHFAEAYHRAKVGEVTDDSFDLVEDETTLRISHKDCPFTSVISKAGDGATGGVPTPTWRYIQFLRNKLNQ